MFQLSNCLITYLAINTKAVILKDFQDVENFERKEIEQPRHKNGEILIKHHYTGRKKFNWKCKCRKCKKADLILEDNQTKRKRIIMIVE